MTNIIFCPECGYVINPDDLSCQNCGKKVKRESVRKSQPESTQFNSQSSAQSEHTPKAFYNDRQQYNPQIKKKSNSIIVVLAVLIFVFALGGAGVFFVVNYFTNKVDNTVKDIKKEFDFDSEKKKESDNKQSKAEENPDSKSENNIENEKIDSKKYPGKYPEGSYSLLSENDLAGYTKHELNVMRNEIFARHGFIFKDPDLLMYFAQQKWYKPERLNVDNLLSKIEKENLETIKQVEKRK
jgi:uncharacterized Zn finger protein (UPF0148 family)